MTLQVSIQQAAANAFATWLGSKLPDCTVEPRWPAASKDLPAKAISIVTAGQRRDVPIDLQLLSADKTGQGATNTLAVWRPMVAYQPMQLDVWAQSDVARDDIIARLEPLLQSGQSQLAGVVNPDPVGAGVLLAVSNGWDAYGSTASFFFEEPDLIDTSNTQLMTQYRATYRGGCDVGIAIPTVTARLVAPQFMVKLTSDDTTYDTYTKV